MRLNTTFRRPLFLLCMISVLLISCNYAKMGMFYLSKNHDRPKLKKNTVQRNSDYTFQFEVGDKKLESRIANIPYIAPRQKAKKQNRFTLDEYLDKQTKTTAFLVIRNDSILYERYWEKFDRSAQLTSFSVAKSFTSSLVGFAIQDGYIKSVHDPITLYIDELKELPGYWNELTIEHLLNMRSGIDFDEDDYVRPRSDIARLYLGKDAMKLISKMKFKCRPNQCHYYSSLDTQILGILVERATKQKLSKYLESKIWKPLGMEYDATWSIDSKSNQNTKSFCCLQAAARDYAKFGKLYLQQGMWEGQQLLNKSWVEKSTQPNFSNNCYQYQWYSGNKSIRTETDSTGNRSIKTFTDSLSAAKAVNNDYQYVRPYYKDPSKWIIRSCGPAFYALGIFAQEIYVDPEKNLIFVRLGQKWDTNNEFLFKLITRHI